MKDIELSTQSTDIIIKKAVMSPEYLFKPSLLPILSIYLSILCYLDDETSLVYQSIM